MAANHKLILASASPRRRELLARAGVDFEVLPSALEEVRLAGESGADYALRMARDKAAAVSCNRPGALVLAADTIVEIDATVLEKPGNPDDARWMLRTLAGRTHTVVTAFALARNGQIVESKPVVSRVTFRKLDDGEIDAYIATGEPFDKAGGYGIQGIAAGFIAHVEGSRDNVMGLPTGEVIAALERQSSSG